MYAKTKKLSCSSYDGDTTFTVDKDVTIYFALDTRFGRDAKGYPAGFMKFGGECFLSFGI